MKPFLDDNFLLKTKTAEYLYHEHAKKLPIIDYHCHLIPQEVADDKIFGNLTQVWLYGDHYKWRAMRTNGAAEKYCTGNASDYEKFEKWAETVPNCLRNPLYHWTHLELQRYFDVKKLLSPKTAREIYDEVSAKVNTKEFSARNMMKMMNVEVVCTTDDPIDNLEHHIKIKTDGFSVKVLPTWRPDLTMAVDNTTNYNAYIEKLENVSGITISKFNNLIDALRKRHDYFAQNGCKLSDHGVDYLFSDPYTDSEIEAIFNKIRSGKDLNNEEKLKFKSAMCYQFAVMDFEKNWTQQWHFGTFRDNNKRLYNSIGPNIGCDSIGDFQQGLSMTRFLNRLDMENKLSKTILYNLNPNDNELVATMLGNFQDGEIPGKIQMGSGWWFNDQKDGMERQMNTLSTLGLLSRFVGMLTDSRSLLSYPRHEYFRRILCNLLGNDVENGEIPNDMKLIGQMVENISYYNAKQYFNM